jgi:hypothetical protein
VRGRKKEKEGKKERKKGSEGREGSWSGMDENRKQRGKRKEKC